MRSISSGSSHTPSLTASERAYSAVWNKPGIREKGAAYTGPGPGVRTESRGLFMFDYLTDVRGERIVVVQVSWFG